MSLDFSLRKVEEHEVYSRNITHNLTKMASEAGLYECLWHPFKNGYEKGSDIIDKLKEGLKLLRADRDKYQKLNPENGWGDYYGFIAFVEGILEAVEEHPDARLCAHI